MGEWKGGNERSIFAFLFKRSFGGFECINDYLIFSTYKIFSPLTGEHFFKFCGRNVLRSIEVDNLAGIF